MTRDIRVKELVKMGARSALRRRGIDIVRHPFVNRLAATLDWLDVTAVLDVGANIGQYGSALRSVGYRGRLCSCEPLADAYALLARRASRDPSWATVHTAVGAAPTHVDMFVSANSYSSSLREMTSTHLDAAPDSRITRTERVPVTTVVDLLDAQGLRPRTTLLKVDTQGYEAEVLDGAGASLADFAAVQLELSFVPLYEAQQLFTPLVARMVDAGFTLFGLEPGMSEPVTGRLLQCDGLFVNAARLPADGAAGAGPR